MLLLLLLQFLMHCCYAVGVTLKVLHADRRGGARGAQADREGEGRWWAGDGGS